MALRVSASWHRTNMENIAEKGKVGLADFTADMFEPLVGQTLIFERPDSSDTPTLEPVRMKLLEVKRNPKSPAVRREPFSLLFVMKDQPPLGKGLHGLAHPYFEPD